VIRGWPADGGGDIAIKKAFERERGGVRLSAFDFTCQVPIRLTLYVARTGAGDSVATAELRALDEEGWGTFEKEFTALLRESDGGVSGDVRDEITNAGGVVAFLAPRGIGPTRWGKDERDRTQIRRRFMLVGQTLDGMRVWDIRRGIQALRLLEGFSETAVSLRADRTMAGNALYASLFEPRLASLDLAGLPASHREGPTYLNVLRFLDIPQAIAMARERTKVNLSDNR
jgi:hypothetical protein